MKETLSWSFRVLFKIPLWVKKSQETGVARYGGSSQSVMSRAPNTCTTMLMQASSIAQPNHPQAIKAAKHARRSHIRAVRNSDDEQFRQ